MEALEYRIARDLFIAAERIGLQLLETERQASAATPQEDQLTGDVFEFSVTFLELLGKRVVDLLEPIDALPIDEQGNPIRKEVPINEDKVC
jgi:kinesin family member 2/24